MAHCLQVTCGSDRGKATVTDSPTQEGRRAGNKKGLVVQTRQRVLCGLGIGVLAALTFATAAVQAAETAASETPAIAEPAPGGGAPATLPASFVVLVSAAIGVTMMGRRRRDEATGWRHAGHE